MKNSTINKITFFVFLLGILVLTNFKVGASIDSNGTTIGVDGSETTVTAPTAKAATKITGNSFQANWSAVKGVVGYKLYVYTVGKLQTKTYVTGYNPKTLSGATTIKSTVSGLSSNTTYYFALKAVNADGKGTIDSDLSNVISVTTTAPTTYVPDDNFEAYLEVNGMGNDIANDNYVFTDRINTVTDLDVSSKSIAGLIGIADFIALEELDCSNNDLTGMDVSANTALEELECSYNDLTELNVSANTALKYLFCGDNDLTALNVLENKELKYLICHYNAITNLDVSSNTALTYLLCDNNQLSDLNLKNGNNSNLSPMSAYANPDLTCIEVDDAASAVTYANWEKDATASYSESCAAPAPPVALAATNITTSSFQVNWEASNSASSYKLYLLGELQDQPGSFSHITGYNGKDVTGTNFVIPENTLEQGVKHYYFVRAINSSGMSSESNTVLVTTKEPMTHVPDDNFEQELIDKGYDTAPLDDYVPTANISTLTSLLLSNKGIASLTGIEDFVALTKLWCYSNTLESLDVSKNTELTLLSCSNNALTSLDVSKNTELTTLYCNNNDLAILDVSKNTELTELWCYNNNLTSLDVSKNTKVTMIFCSGNALISLDVSKNTKLTRLSCFSNELTELNLKNGNNSNMLEYENGGNTYTGMKATSNPNLTCIEVDDPAWSTTNWTDIDATASFSTNCAALLAPEIYGTVQVKDSSFWAEWYAVEDATEYKLTVYSLNESGDKIYFPEHNPKVITDGKGTYVRGLSPNTTYYWYVQASNVDGDSEKSETQTVKTSRTGPAVIQITNITSSSCDVSWSALPGIIEYNLWVYVYFEMGGEYFEGFEPKAVTDTHYSVEGLSPDTHYAITVSAVFIDGETEPTDYSIGTITTLRSNMLSLSASSETGGSVSGGGNFDTGTSVTAQATANAGYEFVNWTESGTEVSTQASYTFNLNEDKTLVANFANTAPPSAPEIYGTSQIKETSFWVEWRSVENVSEYKLTLYSLNNSGDKVYVSAYNPKIVSSLGISVTGLDPNTTYYWYVQASNSNGDSEKSDLQGVKTSMAESETKTLSISATTVEGGTVNGGATVNTGTSVTAEATANNGYAFVNWTEGGIEVSTETSYTFTLNEDRTLVANFRSTTGIDDKEKTPITFWPNPASDILNISEIPAGSSIKLISLLGLVVIQKNDCNKLEKINIESLKNGIYILVVKSEETQLSKKIIKK